MIVRLRFSSILLNNPIILVIYFISVLVYLVSKEFSKEIIVRFLFKFEIFTIVEVNAKFFRKSSTKLFYCSLDFLLLD